MRAGDSTTLGTRSIEGSSSRTRCQPAINSGRGSWAILDLFAGSLGSPNYREHSSPVQTKPGAICRAGRRQTRPNLDQVLAWINRSRVNRVESRSDSTNVVLLGITLTVTARAAAPVVLSDSGRSVQVR